MDPVFDELHCLTRKKKKLPLSSFLETRNSEKDKKYSSFLKSLTDIVQLKKKGSRRVPMDSALLHKQLPMLFGALVSYFKFKITGYSIYGLKKMIMRPAVESHIFLAGLSELG